MSYSAAIDELNAMAPELYAHPGQPRRKFSLDEVRTLLAALGDPHRRFRSVLIAGTNGKGSTAATLASILTASGARAGLYTSPHLQRVNERIRINDSEIADGVFARLYFRVHEAAQQLVLQGSLPQHPSFFEILTAMAFVFFAEENVDLAVLEVGMGGRLDATNVVDPLLSIITDISLDHTEWLGTTLAAIAREKAGILRPGGTMIRLPQLTAADDVLTEIAKELGVRTINASAFMPSQIEQGDQDKELGAPSIPQFFKEKWRNGWETTEAAPYPVNVLDSSIEVASPLAGVHQRRNIALAIAAAVELACDYGFHITPHQIAEGIRNTQWRGRLEHIKQGRIDSGGISWILDVAHNPAGAWAVRSGLSYVPGGRTAQTLVFSCLRDKPLTEMAKILFPLFERVILTQLHTARAAAMEDLVAAAQLTEKPFLVAESVADALQLASKHTSSGPIVVCGSVYLVGEARSLLLAERGIA
jgi:dihydrofolate synthase/folylpolyglutamate synthase